MDNTNEFVEKIHDKQRKDQKNKKRQGKGEQGEKLPGNNQRK
ncbi:DUF4023 domain-containing protein [Bacillaceae bacterium S4-13-58]